ncbi:MAG: hypothetical protein DI533_17260 [Cereibacter sphaeroides]|uniref:Uncharacterized protein n=1 Tax=Cereibacter sphaeroides TaxID=1063 RepID=A0A2W5TZC8_CERSP|nr:MAG: hypothetical protein DI533_17260 [Cereibacter sphaeroides]
MQKLTVHKPIVAQLTRDRRVMATERCRELDGGTLATLFKVEVQMGTGPSILLRADYYFARKSQFNLGPTRLHLNIR